MVVKQKIQPGIPKSPEQLEWDMHELKLLHIQSTQCMTTWELKIDNPWDVKL